MSGSLGGAGGFLLSAQALHAADSPHLREKWTAGLKMNTIRAESLSLSPYTGRTHDDTGGDLPPLYAQHSQGTFRKDPQGASCVPGTVRGQAHAGESQHLSSWVWGHSQHPTPPRASVLVLTPLQGAGERTESEGRGLSVEKAPLREQDTLSQQMTSLKHRPVYYSLLKHAGIPSLMNNFNFIPGFGQYS